MKTCTRCKKTKDISDFSILTRSSDGRQSQCKACKIDSYNALRAKRYPESFEAGKRKREAESLGLKYCYRCSTAKSPMEFNKNKTTKDGMQVFCKLCMTTCTLESVRKNRAYYNGKASERYNRLKHIPKTQEQIEAARKRAREYYKRNPQYQSTKYMDQTWLVIASLWAGMKQRSKRRGHPMPNFTRKEFVDWLWSSGLGDYHADYVASEFDKWKKPSVDRLDNSKPYTLDNIRLVTWKDNLDATRVK